MKNTIEKNGKKYVCRIFDSGPEIVDRYTIAFKGYRILNQGMIYPYLASSAHPFHPQGFGQHCESREFLTGRQLGKRIAFDSIPADVKTFILQNLGVSK